MFIDCQDIAKNIVGIAQGASSVGDAFNQYGCGS